MIKKLLLILMMRVQLVGHAFSKMCQYTTTHEKMSIGMPCAFIKVV
jgi:hypothetical protein